VKKSYVGEKPKNEEGSSCSISKENQEKIWPVERLSPILGHGQRGRRCGDGGFYHGWLDDQENKRAKKRRSRFRKGEKRKKKGRRGQKSSFTYSSG